MKNFALSCAALVLFLTALFATACATPQSEIPVADSTAMVRVLDLAGEPIPEVRITVGDRTYTTDQSGSAKVGPLAAGTYFFSTSAEDYHVFPVTGFRDVVLNSEGAEVDFLAIETSAYPEFTFIHEIQGDRYSVTGERFANVIGVVTAVAGRGNAFWMQSPEQDGDINSSEGIYVFIGNDNTAPSVGDWVVLPSANAEERFGNSQLAYFDAIEPIYSGDLQIKPTLLGDGGRRIPHEVISDGPIDGSFDVENEGLDFYESLEGMLVHINNPMIISGFTRFELAVVADRGKHASGLNDRGSLLLSPGDFNPERMYIDTDGAGLEPIRIAKTGDILNGPVVGPLHYTFGNYVIAATSMPELTSVDLAREESELMGDENTLTVASFNILNYPAQDDGFEDFEAKTMDLAETIVHALNAPDIIGLQEMGDDNGATDDPDGVGEGVIGADQNYALLIDAITSIDPNLNYDFRQIDPNGPADEGNEGGWPEANIRVGFLFRSDRVEFIDSGEAGPSDATSVTADGNLTLNPGRIDPGNPAFTGEGLSYLGGSREGDSIPPSRRSLVAQFSFSGERVYVINNHFPSKSGSDDLFGMSQPIYNGKEEQRIAVAEVINSFVDDILSVDSGANVIVLGDLNEFDFEEPLAVLKGDVLVNLIEKLPVSERYSYHFDGNAQVLDHILISDGLSAKNPQIDIVHRYSEFEYATRFSDHDPVLASFDFD